MTIDDVDKAGESLSMLVARALAGDDIVINKDGVPVAKLVHLEKETLPRRRLGMLAGKVKVPVDFDHPLSDDVIAAFEGRCCAFCSTRTS